MDIFIGIVIWRAENRCALHHITSSIGLALIVDGVCVLRQ
jgi:hypothetical protein